jgi:DNA-binding beta-propeller fold protein YncE
MLVSIIPLIVNLSGYTISFTNNRYSVTVKRTCIAYDPEHERMYVTDFITNNVYVIDTNTLK